MNEGTGSETRRMRIDGWTLVRDDKAGRERWLVADDDGEVRAHIEIERHRAFAYTEDGKSVMDLAVSSVRGARSRADGYGLADDASRKAVLDNIMLLLPVYLPG